MLYLIYFLSSVLLLLLYFKIAAKFNIVARPNHRSSHSNLTILGAGVIFPLILVVHSLSSGINYPYFTSGLILISVLSFYDDLKPLSFIIRLFGHLLAVYLMFTDAGLTDLPVWLVIVAYVLVIGTINAYNFMDGINGITAGYSLVTVLTLFYINENVVNFVISDWLMVCAMSILAFSIFNFRTAAKCFAGDVGSVGMAFILIFFIVSLIVATEDFKYIGLLLVYGLDSVTTIGFRLVRRENIFLAHRSHFYQYLANSKRWPHVRVSLLYAILQLGVNALLLTADLDLVYFVIAVVVTGIIVVVLRFAVEGKEYLLKRQV